MNPDGAHFCNRCGTELPTPRSALVESRRTVTVLFCDVSGSTLLGESLDPEAFRRVLARYFEAMREVISVFGGTVEKFIGDAVMAVFGVPTLHEDDALRAVQTAAKMREALRDLNASLRRDHATEVELRIGVETGEVVAGTSERLVAGDVVNVAARLQQAAEPGQILIGERTKLLTQHAVQVENIGPLTLKGKSVRVEAYAVTAVGDQAGFQRHLERPMVGRDGELAELQRVFAQIRESRTCRLETLIGAPGVGKSRLAMEFLVACSSEARVVRSRCLPYGSGITYWPVIESLRQMGELETFDIEPAAAAVIQQLLEGGSVAAMDEIAWAFSKVLAGLGDASPLVLLIDDIQWAEAPVLDLIEHLPLAVRGVPVLVLCLARPELLGKQPHWPHRQLAPLSAADAEVLAGELLRRAVADSSLRRRIAEYAAGNPLFLEELAASVLSSPSQELSAPPSLQALIAARIDQLEPQLQRLLACAAVEGERFHRGAVQMLAGGSAPVMSGLNALVRRDFLAADTAELAGEEGYRFKHILVRDAAYEATSKAMRADLHERLADWLERRMPAGLPETNAILAHHLENTWRYRCAVGVPDEHDAAIARHAAELLVRAGDATAARGDTAAATSLLKRAASLLPSDSSEAAATLRRLGRVLRDAGDYPAMRDALSRAITIARACGARAIELGCQLELHFAEDDTNASRSGAELRQELAHAVRELEQLGDDEGLAIAWHLWAQTHNWEMQFEASIEAVERSIDYARKARTEDMLVRGYIWLFAATWYGTGTPEQLLRLVGRIPSPAPPRLEVARWMLPAHAAAMEGRFNEARSLVGRILALQQELGIVHEMAGIRDFASYVELLAGDPVAAERHIDIAYTLLEEIGAVSFLSTVAWKRALLLHALGKLDEAQAQAEVAKQISAPDDADAQAGWRTAMSALMTTRGETDAAIQLAAEAVAIRERTDGLNEIANANTYLAEALRAAGQHDVAMATFNRALSIYERKGNVAAARLVRARLQARASTSESDNC